MKLSVPQYAKTVGISKVAAYKRVNTGKISVDANGMVDVETAKAQWEANRDAMQGARNPSGLPRKARPAAATHTEDRSSLAEAQRAREWLRVKREKLALELAEGKTVELAPINAYIAGMVIKARDELVRIAPEICDQLAQETDPVLCHEIIARRLQRALGTLAEYRPDA